LIPKTHKTSLTMKKFLLSFLASASLYSAHSQVLFQEDFDNIGGPTAGGAGTYTFPAGWFLRNVDNRTPAGAVSYVNEAWERREDFNFSVVDSCVFSTSWYTPAGTSDDWMWTPLIGPIQPNTILSWNGVAYDPMYQDGYEVRIMTAASGPPTGGTGVIGNQLTSSTQIFATAAEASSWTAHSVNLNAYAGQSVYIGFRNTSTDKFLLLIDDIKVEVQINYDAGVTAVDTMEYTLIPTTQSTPINFDGRIHNYGLMPLTNVMLNVSVYNGVGSGVYSASSTPANLAAGADANFSVAPYTPVTPDLYTIKYYTTSTETDQNNTNDTLYNQVEITDSTYARDNGTVTGGLGIGAGNGGYLGQDFLLSNTDDLTSVGMYFTRGYTGKKFAAVIWNMSGGVPSTIIGGTDTLLYPDDSARYYNIKIHGGPLNLTAGRYAVTAVEFDSTISVGLTSGIFTANRTWVNWPTNPLGGWGNNEDFGSGFAKSYVIRPNFGSTCTLSVGTPATMDPTCAGAANGSATINTSGGTGPFTYSWSPNVSATASASNLAAGNYTVTVTDINSCVSSVSFAITDPAAVDVSTTYMGDTISANASAGTSTFLWVDCDNGNTVIPGETSQDFTPTVPGNYAVIVTTFGCTDTSACVPVLTIGLAQHTPAKGTVSVFPNPSTGTFTIHAAGEGTYTISNELGQAVKTIALNAKNNFSVTVNDLGAGVYMISGTASDKAVKQKIVITK
jgi:hypothetical protein